MVKSHIYKGLQPLLHPDTQTRQWLRLITKRLVRLAMALALLFIIYNVWNIASFQSQQQLTEHTRELTVMTLAQVEHQAINDILQQDTAALESAAEQLLSHRAVLAVTFRDPLGETIVSLGAHNSLIDWPQDSAADPWVMTNELHRDGGNLGYLEVIFDRHVLLAKSEAAHNGLMQQGRVLLLLAMLAGVFIMLGFNRIRDKFWQRRHSSQPK